jgi:two-component system sensor histidine kinase PilS (NtrC family)
VNGHTRNAHADDAVGGTTQPYSPSGLLSWFGQHPTGASGLEEQWAQAGLTGWGADVNSPDLNGGALTEATRTHKAFLSARLVLALALLAVVMGAQALGTPPPDWMPVLAVTYALATATLRFAPTPWIDRALRQGLLHTRHLLPSVGLDLTVFAGLHALAASNVNSQALLVLPVLMAAVLAPRILALGTAAVATLILLGIALLPANQASGSASSLLTQAGLTGLGLFVMAVLANELASRLAKEERSARGSLALAQQQAELNGLMIDEMSEGVMVLDRQGRVRAANPAARKLIAAQGMGPSAPFKVRGVPAWATLMQAIEAALNQPELADHGQDVRLTFDDRQERDLRVRTRFTRSRQRRSEDLCVVLLEDLRTVRARQRQDKLAAMGRMSAGIAHEIRNPLAAIAQANSLLAETSPRPRSSTSPAWWATTCCASTASSTTSWWWHPACARPRR